jgi:acetoin utilization protein AcuB
MSRPVITIHPDKPIMEALELMQQEHIRRLPVVNHKGHLVGIISKSDILHAAPSDASSLSVWEVNYLISKITVKKVMTSEVITITGDTPLEEAARIMADHKVGGLPVLHKQEVVGIITETDLFKIFLEMLGAREKGIRLSILVPSTRGELAALTQAIFDAGGTILSLGTFLGESSDTREITLKLEGASPVDISSAIRPHVIRILDIREA